MKDLIEFCNRVKPAKLAVTKDPLEIEFKTKIFNKTSFLDVYDKVPLSLRYYVILNNINSIPVCKCCDNIVTYNKSYPNRGFVTYCSPECSRSNKTVSNDILVKLSNKEWLYHERIILKKSKDKIAEELGCSHIPVQKWIKVHNLPEVKYNESNAGALTYLRDYNWLYNEHVNLRKTCTMIGDSLNVSGSTVSVYLSKLNIEANSPNSYERKAVKVSKPTLEIKDFIREFYDGEIKLNARGIIGDLELDIYLPEMNFAIEFNGVYSHLYRPEKEKFSERKDSTYHVTKTNLCESKNIQLMHIFSLSLIHI